MEEYRNGMPVVKRKAALLFADNLAAVIDVTIPCDIGNHMAPRWPMTINFHGKQFQFQRDSHEPQKRPMYREVVESQEPPKEVTIEDYKVMHEYHEKLIMKLAMRVLAQNPNVGSVENVVSHFMQMVDEDELNKLN